MSSNKKEEKTEKAVIFDKQIACKLYLLQNLGEPILLGGSLVLNELGIINRQIGDLDLIIDSRPANLEQLRAFRLLESLYPISTNNPQYYKKDYEQQNGVEHIRFMLDGIKVCVFATSNERYLIPINRDKHGFKFINPNVIIEFKQKYVDEWEKKVNWNYRDNCPVNLSRLDPRELRDPIIPEYIKKHKVDIGLFKDWYCDLTTKVDLFQQVSGK